MNKAFMVGLSLALILSLSACGNTATKESDNDAQGTSTPEVAQPVVTSTPEVEQTTQTVQETPTETPSVEETPTIEETPAPAETTEQSTPEVQLFTDCNETVYATTTVNVRSSYSASSDKLGSLTKAQSVTRTGTGTGDASGWSRVEFNGQVAYVSSDYLSTTKPQVTTSKPSTGSSNGSSGAISSGDIANTGKPFEPTPGVDWVYGETLTEEDLGDPREVFDESNVGGWYNPATGEFFEELPD